MSEQPQSLDEILKRIAAEHTSRTSTPTSSSANPHASDAGSGITNKNLTAFGQTGLGESVICPVCRGVGFYVLDLPFGHPEFGRAVPCHCRDQERLERRMRKLQMISSHSLLSHLTFASFNPVLSNLDAEKALNLRSIFDTCVTYAQNPDGWLLLMGTYGCGKTHLAAAVANERSSMGYPVIFMTAPDLLDQLRSAYSPNTDSSYDERFEQLRTAPLLVLDDLGAQSSTPWAQEKLFQLLNYRYNLQLPTVITTNLRLDELEPRLRSRLMDAELVNPRTILAPDYRAGRISGESELSMLSLYDDKLFSSFQLSRRDTTASEQDNLREAVQICRGFAKEPHGWLVLSGRNGCGKTHLAAAIANDYYQQTGNDVMFVVVPDLLDHLRATYSPQSSTPYDRRFDEIRRAQMLVLDDLGTESATPWAREKLFQLLNFRYVALLPTVVTTSSKPDQIEPWLRQRMLDINRCRWFGITAPGFLASRNEHTDVTRRSTRKSR